MNEWIGTFGVAILEVGSCPFQYTVLKSSWTPPQHIVGATQDRLGIQH